MSAKKKEHWVLVVDDDPDVRELIVEDLVDQFNGELRIVEAADGVQASGKLDNQIFDCIITDLKMPKRDGDQFIEWVRQSQRNRHSPVVIVSGAGTAEIANKYPNVHILEKPINFKTFGETIRTQLKLGRLDKRVSADLFNGLLDLSRRHLGKMLATIPQMDPPEPKVPGSSLRGDCQIYISIKGPYGLCDAVFGFSKELLAHLPKAEGTNLDKIALALTSTVLNQFFITFAAQNRSSQAPKLEQKILLSSKEGQEVLPSLNACGGLHVHLKFFEHGLFLTMLNRKH